MRRFLLLLLAAAAVLLFLVATLPWWWGGMVRAAGGAVGLEFAEYQRDGYNRWVLTDVRWRQGGTEIEVERLVADHPLRWAWRPRSGRGLVAGRWRVAVDPSATDPAKEPPAEPFGWARLQALLTDVEEALTRWLPEAELGPGVVSWPGGQVEVAGARWHERRLELDAARYGRWQADVAADWGATPGATVLQVRRSTMDAELDATVSATALEGRGRWRGQSADFSATFAPQGWLPTQAVVDAPAWDLRGEDLRLGAYYARVAGQLQARWVDGIGSIRAHATGRPLASAEGIPPLEVHVEAHGNANRVTVQTLEVQVPGVTARLDAPVTVDPRGAPSAPADFRLQADLAQLPMARAAGQVNGLVRLRPQPSGWPQADVQLELHDGAYGEVEQVAAVVEAEVTWPWVKVRATRWQDSAGTRVEGEGAFHVQEKSLEHVSLKGRLAAATVQPWLPANVQFAEVELSAEASGPLGELQHRGELEVAALQYGPLHPLQLAGRWSGSHEAVQLAAEIRSATGTLVTDVNVTPERALIERLEVRGEQVNRFALQQPAELRWSPAWQVRQLHLEGPALELRAEVADARSGRVDVTAPRMAFGWLEDWMARPLPVQALRELTLRSDLVEGVLQFVLAAQGTVIVAEDNLVEMTVRAAGTPDGLHLEQAQAALQGESIVVFSGRLPITLRPGKTPVLAMDEDGPLQLTGRLAPSDAFWTAVAETTGVHVASPRVEVDLTGRWSRPQGEARVRAERVEMVGARGGDRVPVLTDLTAVLRGDGQGLLLEELRVDVEGQSLKASARVPLTPAQWAEARKHPVEYLRAQGQGRVDLPDADLAALARLAPQLLAPAGRVSAHLRFPGGGKIEGGLQLKGAVSRPLGPLGVLQEITADLAFAGRQVELKTVEALMGGQPLRLSGQAVLPPGEAPQLNLSLVGYNLPLVRETGVLLRADLDLALSTQARGAGRVTGQVRLRDGLFLRELQDVVPRGGGGTSRPAARPPFFSVTIDPLHQWTLDVAVEGRDFMRLRTPLLMGTASASFQLTGTLGTPRAVGEVRVEDGRIRLPFATFAIESGEVRLTQADPYQPQLSLTATSRRLGYDLRMELTGTASEPRLEFTSTPSLPSESIVLLVMAGQAPQAEVTYTGGQRAVQLGAFIGRGVLGDLLGSDGEDRLTITTGERISRQGRETYRFSYELSPRLSLVGEYDEFDSYNAGVRWRLLPRPPAEDAAQPEEAYAE